MDQVRWIMCESSFRLPSHDARTQPCSLFIQHESMFKMHQSRQHQTCSLCKIDRINGSEDLRLTDVFLTVSLGFYEQTSLDQRRFWQTHSVGLAASVPDYKASEITAISSKTIKIFHLIIIFPVWRSGTLAGRDGVHHPVEFQFTSLWVKNETGINVITMWIHEFM